MKLGCPPQAHGERMRADLAVRAPSTLNLKPRTLNREPYPKAETRSPKNETRNPKLETLYHEALTRNPEP